jgi:hypothetical protein
MNNTLRKAWTGVYVGNISEKAFTLWVNTTVPPYGSLICKMWFSGHISMGWFDSQLQLLQYCHWKLRKSRLSVSLTKFATIADCQLVYNVTSIIPFCWPKSGDRWALRRLAPKKKKIMFFSSCVIGAGDIGWDYSPSPLLSPPLHHTVPSAPSPVE